MRNGGWKRESLSWIYIDFGATSDVSSRHEGTRRSHVKRIHSIEIDGCTEYLWAQIAGRLKLRVRRWTRSQTPKYGLTLSQVVRVDSLTPIFCLLIFWVLWFFSWTNVLTRYTCATCVPPKPGVGQGPGSGSGLGPGPGWKFVLRSGLVFLLRLCLIAQLVHAS
jgi:hypothetical protein